MTISLRVITALVLVAVALSYPSTSRSGEMEFVQASASRTSFVLSDSSKPFLPWGFNYDHDEQGRLMEDYWENQWPKIEEDFREMKELGANVIRVHLQVGRFMRAPGTPNESALNQLRRLVGLADSL